MSVNSYNPNLTVTVDAIAKAHLLNDHIDVRIEWLVTGEGQMKRNFDTTKEYSEAVDLLATLPVDQQKLVLDFIKMLKERGQSL